METLAEHTAWLVDRFEDDDEYAELESFAHLQQVLDEQCYHIAELEDDEDADESADQRQPGDESSPDWKPLRTYTAPEESTNTEQNEENTGSSGENADDQSDHVGLKEPDEIDSGTMQNPHDEDATYRSKNGEDYHGYKANVAETCNGENPFRLITAVRVDTNNTDDGDPLTRT
ncbi:hypothetical protein ACFQHN_32705 [Natrialbaceae archaeon GCM10025896]